MNTRLTGLIVICAGALSLHAQTLRTAGSLAVDLDAATITAADGDAVTTWANDGTLGASFDALAGTTGAVFTNSLNGRKAVLFDGTAQSVLVGPAAPSSPTVGSYTLISAAGGIQGTFEQTSVPKPWGLIMEPTAVRLTYASGTFMLLK